MKIIETRYNGYRFRSRTEARWAKFFDAMGIRYEYEREGFELDGQPYLPDFYLPDLVACLPLALGPRRGFWFEVKGDEPTQRELRLCGRLALDSRQDVLLAVGAPSQSETGQIIWFHADPGWMLDCFCSMATSGGRWYFADGRRRNGEIWLAQSGKQRQFGEPDAYRVWPKPAQWPLESTTADEAADEAWIQGRGTNPWIGGWPVIRSVTLEAYWEARGARFESR